MSISEREAREPQGGPGGGPVRLRDGAAILAVLFGGQILGALAVGVVMGVDFAAGGGDLTDRAQLVRLMRRVTPVGIVAGSITSFAAVLLYAFWSLRGDARRARRVAIGAVPTRWSAALASLVVGVAIAVGYIAIAHFLIPPRPVVDPGPMTRMGTSPGWQPWGLATIAILFTPWLEEFVFRGQLLAALSQAWGTVVGATATTLLFLALHAPELAGYSPAALGITGVAAATLLVRLWSGSVIPAMTLHFGYNAVLAGTVVSATRWL